MFASFLVRWLVTSLAILMVPSLIAGVAVRDFGSALAAAAVLGVLNALVKPVLILLTLPITFLTLGFFLLVINALLFETAGAMVSGVQIASFWSALCASIVVSLVSWLTSLGDARMVYRFRPEKKRQPRGRVSGTVDMDQGDDGKWQ